MAKPVGDIRFRKEMGISRQEFLHNLAAALAGRPWRVERDEISIEEPSRRISIRLCDQHQQRLGSLQLPRMRVEFSFSGYSEAEAERFMTHVDIHFRRAGG